MPKHAKGPWTVRPGDAGPSSRIIDSPEMDEVACLRGPAEAWGLRDANARLIAAGPDLLAACDAALDTIRRHCRDVLDTPPEGTVFADLWRQLREAVGKATGD